MTSNHNIPQIKNLLLDNAFTVNNIRFFCYDYADFIELYEKLPSDIEKINAVNQLLKYTEQKKLFDVLLTWAKKFSPKAYKKYIKTEMDTQTELQKLRNYFIDSFSMTELLTICQFHLDDKSIHRNIRPYDEFETIVGKIIGHYQARGRLAFLWELLKKERPDNYANYRNSY